MKEFPREIQDPVFRLFVRIAHAVSNEDKEQFARYYDQLRDYCENLDHDCPSAWDALATWTLDPRESFRYFKIALKQLRKQNLPDDPSLPDVLFHVGRLAFEGGNLKFAKKHLAEAQQEALRQYKAYFGSDHGENMRKLEQRIASLLLSIHLADQ
jgi:hypothetical protein